LRAATLPQKNAEHPPFAAHKMLFVKNVTKLKQND
jgi:hypothetical protein